MRALVSLALVSLLTTACKLVQAAVRTLTSASKRNALIFFLLYGPDTY